WSARRTSATKIRPKAELEAAAARGVKTARASRTCEKFGAGDCASGESEPGAGATGTGAAGCDFAARERAGSKRSKKIAATNTNARATANQVRRARMSCGLQSRPSQWKPVAILAARSPTVREKLST